MGKKKRTPKVVAQEAATLERDANVLEMCRQKHTLDEIAKALGFAGKQGAANARDRQLARLADSCQELAKKERRRQLRETARELVILDAGVAAIAPSVVNGVRLDDYARMVLARVRLLTLRAKLTGAMAPTKTEITGLDGGAIKVDVRDELLAQLAGRADRVDAGEGEGGTRR